MRILLVNYELPPVGGGGGNATAHLARELARLGQEVEVLTTSFAGLPAREERDGYLVRRVRSWRRRKDRCSVGEMAVFAVSSTVAALRLRQRFDVAVAFFGFPGGPAVAALRALRGTPYVVSLRGGDVPGQQPGELAFQHAVARPFLVRLWRGAGAVVANGSGLRDMALRSAPELDVELVPNGVDTEMFQPGAERPESGNPLRMLFAGRLSPEKGLVDLFEALGRIDGDGWVLDVVGDGPMLGELRALASRSGIKDKVRFLGWQERGEMPGLYSCADVFVFPSHHEGMPNTVLEAMASGLPVAAADIAGVADVVRDGETGLLAPPGNARALAGNLERLIADSSLRRRLGAAGAERVRDHFSWPEMARRYLEICRRCRGRG